MPKVYKKEYNDTRKRNKRIYVSLTEEEKKEFLRACEVAGLKQVDFIVKASKEALKNGKK